MGQLNPEFFYAEIESVEGVMGRPVWDPQLLIRLWLYAYQDGMSSARSYREAVEAPRGMTPDFYPQAFE